MSFKSALQIYALLACLISSIIILITSGFLLCSITDFVIPKYMNYSQYSRYNTNEDFILLHQDRYANEDQLNNLKTLSFEALTEKRLDEKNQFLENIKWKAVESFIKCLEWLLVASVFFYLHWRIYKRSTQEALYS